MTDDVAARKKRTVIKLARQRGLDALAIGLDVANPGGLGQSYSFVRNCPIDWVDLFGEKEVQSSEKENCSEASCGGTLEALCSAFVPGIPGDPYVERTDGCFNRKCLIGACVEGMECMLDAVKAGGVKAGICAIVCTPACKLGPGGWGVCMHICLGADGLATLVELASCLSWYDTMKEACEVDPCHCK